MFIYLITQVVPHIAWRGWADVVAVGAYLSGLIPLLSDYFQKENFTVYTARSGSAALVKAAECLPDIILLNLMLPGMDGYEVSPIEFSLLECFMRHPYQAFNRLQLMENSHGFAFDGYERTIDAHIRNLRQLELHRQAVDINLLLQHSTDMLAPLLEEKQLTFSLEPAENLPLLSIDADRINQVIYNLLTNAIRYTHPQTTIHIQSFLQAGEVCVDIRDEGPGIAPADLPYVFDHFYRSEKSRNRHSGGSGIGLALARQFAEIHDGTLTAENLPAGGSRFTLRLPVKAG